MQDAPRQNGCDKLTEVFNDADNFATGFRFNTGGKKTLTTTFGALISIMMYIILFLYGALQLQRLYEFNETVVTMSVKDSYYSMDDIFPTDVENM